MEQFSLDTAVIPYFTPESKVPHCKRDIKNFFENILMKEEFQDQTDLVKTSLCKEVGNATSGKSTPSDLERSYHATYDAKLLGNESIKRLELESTVNFSHELLIKLQNSSFDMGKPVQTISLDVSHAGIKINDKIFKNCLHHHPIHKISHVILDFKNARHFGYLYGDFLNGHQFFAFETDRSATEVVSLLRSIFEVELIRKKKEKLEMQASQVFLSLKNFLSLAHELKFREIEIPVLLKRRMDMVKDINWWLEGTVDECSVAFEEPEEQLLHVSLQNLYAAACQLKLIEIQKDAAAQKEKERLAGKRHWHKKKVTKEKTTDEEFLENESHDPLLIEASNILAEDILYWQSILLKERYEQLKKDEISVNFNHENLNLIRDFCFSVFNAWNQETKSLNDKIESLTALERSERGKIKQEVISIYTGKKQSLRVTKKLKEVNLFEDTDFQVPKRREKTDCELLNSIFSCEEYFLHALKIRREETEDLNYFISKLHYRPNIHDPEDSTTLHYCRRLLIKAVKMKLKEIQDIEDNLEELKKAKEKIYYLIPDTIKYSADRFKKFINKQRTILECVRSQLSDFDVDLKVSEETVEMCYKIYDDLMELRKMYIKNIEKEIAEIQETEKSVKNIANICFLLYSQAVKMRKKEFHTIIADLDVLESIEADCFTLENKQLLMHCQEEYMTAASMREKEMEALKFRMKTADKKLKIEDSEIKATLKDLFYAAVEMEKNECEKILSKENEFSDSQVLPIVFTFKDLYEGVALDLKQSKPGVSSLKDSQVTTTLRKFLLSAFEFQQKDIEIPMSSLKKDLENVLRRLIENVERRYHQKLKKREIHEQALKISRSWKEVFLLAINIRQKETEKNISSKRKEIEEQAIFNLMQDDSHGKSNNMANIVVKIWKKIFSDVIDMKGAEMQKIMEILKKTPGDQVAEHTSKLNPGSSNVDVDYSNAIGKKGGPFKENYMPGLKTESPDVDDLDEEYYEIDNSDVCGKEEGPFEELMKAIATCNQIYDVAINKGWAQLDEMELEIQPVFSDEFAEEKDLQADEVCTTINKSSSLIAKFIDNMKTEMSQIESNIGSLTHIKENIKSQAVSAKSTSNNFLKSLLELEEKALNMTEENINQLDKIFEKLLSDDSEKFCPFTDLLVDVMSDDGSMQSESEEPKKKEELVSKEVGVSNNIMDKEEIQSFLLKVEAELQTGSNKQIQNTKEVIDAYESFKNELEFASEMQRSSINSINKEIENLKLPDPKKLKTKEKNQRASKCITDCMEILSKSFSFRHSAIKAFQSNIERMKATQPKEQVMIEYESSDIVGRCRNLFLLIKETRRRNLTHMKSEMEKLESKTHNLPVHIDAEAVSYLKSEICTSCRDLVLESIDIKMQEIDDISTEIEFLNIVGLKIKNQLKQLSVEKHKVAITKLEKANDAVAICKKVCSSASEKAKKEVKDSDELQLLKEVLQSTELGNGDISSKNLNFVDEIQEEKSQATEKSRVDEKVELKQTGHVDMEKDLKIFPSWLDRFLALLDFQDESAPLITSNFNQSSDLATILEDSQLSGSFLMKSNDIDAHLLELENYKNLLKSLEKKREKQAIYTISSWDDLFLRSFLKNQIEKSNIENETYSYDISEVIMRERSWEDLFYEADSLVRKQENLAAKLKEAAQLSISMSSWTDVLVEAIKEWNIIIEKEIQHLQDENLLLQWRGSTKSKKISNYSSGSQYGYKSTNFHDYIKEFENQNEFPKETPTTLNKSLSSWDNLFEKSVELIIENRKAMNFMQKKSTKFQSQIINISSSWDELFSNAIMQRKNDLQEEIKESNELKSLAKKVVNAEIQGTDQAAVIKTQKYDSWQQLICDTSEEHRAEILDAIKAKKSEIEKSSLKRAVFERESADNLFLTLKSEMLIDQGRKLMADALEIRKSEIEAMENELKKLSAINRENHHSNKIPLSVILWKLILSVALSFKKSGLKYEAKKEKHFKINSEDLIKAALQSKLKESEDFESYWEKFGDKLIFMQITPANMSWSKFLESTSELAKTDIGKMSMLGIKSKEKLESEGNVDDDLNVNLDAIEDSMCWMDLIIEAVELKDSKAVSPNDLECTITDISTDKPLISWDEVFYLMNLMCKNTVMKIFIEKKVWDHLKLKDIQNMVSSNFFTWDNLIVGVIEEVLWTFQELSQSFGDSPNEESDIVSLLDECLEENSLKDILKKLNVKSFIDLLPSKEDARKLELEDSLNKQRKIFLFPEAGYERTKFNEETIWKTLFPIAVEVWMKNMQFYLDFQSFYSKKGSSFNNSVTKVCFEHTGNETFSNSELHNSSNLSSLQNLEKEIAYEYLSDIEPNFFENFSDLDQPKGQSLISKFSPVVVADMKKKFKDGENINPEYFNVMCTWHELFKAALQRNKQFLKEIMDFQETEEYSSIQNSTPETPDVSKKEDLKSVIQNKTTGTSDDSKKRNLKFNVFNVINQEITLTDLFEVIDSLKKKNLIFLKELKRKEMMVEATPAITSENLEVSNAIDSFSEFFLKAFQFRCYEKKMLEEEIGQLMIVTLNNCHKYKAHPVLLKLKFYFDTAVEKRREENETIHFILEHLNKFKTIFYGYLECPVTESLIQRNDKHIKEMNSSLTDIEEHQNALTQSFRNCYNSLMFALDGYLKRRESEVDFVEMEQVNQFADNLEVDHRRNLNKLQKLFLSIMEFRKREIIDMKKQLFHWKRLNDREESIENIIHEIISSILKHFENELVKREKAASLMSEEKEVYQRNKADLRNKISSASSYCKDFLLSALANRNKEISFIESDLQSVKSLSEQPNKKTREVINLYEKLCEDFVTMREGEIKKLEKIFSELNGVEVPKMQSVCIEYISQAVVKRKNELAVLTEVIESLDVFEEVAESEISESFEEALADVIDFSSGMTFLHTVSSKKDDIKDKCDIKVLKKCFDFYVKRNADVQLEIRTLEENAESMKFFKGGSILKLINIFEDFETLLDKRLHSVELDRKSIISEQTFVKKLQTSFISKIYGCLIRSKNYFQDCLSDTEHDLYVLKLKLNILNEDSQDKFEKVLDPSFPDLDDFNTRITDEDKTEISPQTTLTKDDIQYSEESFFVKECYDTLNSALEFRINYIGILSSELKSMSSFNIKIFHLLTKCYDVTFDMSKKRKKEKAIIKNMLESAKSISRTNIVHTCIECLNCLLLYNTECLNAIMLDLERLQSMLKNMKKKQVDIFNFCKEKLQYAIDVNVSEIEAMKAVVATKEFIQAKEDSKYADSTDSIIERGIEIRNKEIENMRNILENLQSETEETSSVVVSCHGHFKISGINRNEEITAVEEQINILEDEAPMLFLVYLSALETIIEENKKAMDHSKSIRENLAKIKFEIKEEKEKGIQFCLKLYCSILETLKIEKEAIKYDVDSLQKVEQESKYKIDTEGKEVIVSFKDLYLAAFDMKKTKLENEIRTQNVEENVKSKTIEIIESLLKEKYSDKSVISEKFPEITFEEFVKYYEIKKEKRRSMIEQEIMDEFETIEKMFGFDEGFNIVKYSEENIDDEDEMETKSKTPERFNRVYEVKMEEVEEDITYKNKKITGAINMRKKMMESIVLMKKKDLLTKISMKEREMKDAIESVKGMQSNVMCSLKDLYDEMIQLKNNSSDFNLMQNINGKFVPEKFKDLHLSVKLEKFLDIALEIKEAEVQMIVPSACKKVDKLVSFMKREIEERIKNSKEKLREEIKQYRKVQKARVREYAMSGAIIQTQDYIIDENKLFPDISSFQCYVESLYPTGLAGFFMPQPKRSCTIEDMTFHSEEFSKNCCAHIPFFQKYVSSMVSIPNYVLKLLELEINSLMKVVFEMNCDKAKAVLHGLSFISVENISQDASVSRMNKMKIAA